MGKRVSDTELLRQMAAARRRTARLRRTVPHASAVRFDRRLGQVAIALTNGALLGIPVDLVDALRGADARDLADVSVGPGGVGLHWEALDVQVSVASLARLALGSGVLLRAAGAAGGSARSAAKSAAARRNGRRGGRPRKHADQNA